MGLFKGLCSLFTSSGKNTVSAPSNNSDTTNKVETPATVEKAAHTTDKNSDNLITEYIFDGEVKIGTKIKVNPTELLAVTKDGVIIEMFSEGEYIITDSNLFKFTNSVPYTISLLGRTNKWSTNEPIIFTDNDYGEVSLRACGTYHYNLWDPVTIVTNYINEGPNFSLHEYTRNLVVNTFEKVIQSYNGTSFTQLPTKEICNAVHEELRATGFGFTIEIQMIKPTEESITAINQAMQNKILNNQ